MRVAFDIDGVVADLQSVLVREAEVLFGRTLTITPEVDEDHPLDGLTARGESLAAFDRRCIPAPPHRAGKRAAGTPAAGCVAPPSNTPGIATPPRKTRAAGAPVLGRRALPPGRLAGLGATPDFHHGLLSHRERQRLWRRIATIENFWETLEETEEGAVARIAAVASKRRWEVLFITKRPATVGAAAQTQTQRWLCDKGFPLPAVYVVRRSRGAIAEALGLDAVVDDQLANCLDVVADSHARPLLLCRHAEPSGTAVRAGPAVTRPAPVTLVRSITECLDVLEAMDSEV